jgi:ADP-heptose:LPS heptosyltransferase
MTTVSVVFRYSALGDVVLSSAFIEGLHVRDPAGEIVFVTQEAFKGFVESRFPGPLRVWTLPRKLGLLRAFTEGQRLARFLRDLNPGADIDAYDLHAVPKSIVFFWGFRLQEFQERRRVFLVRVRKLGLRRRLSVFLGRDLIGPRSVFREAQALLGPLASSVPTLRVTREERPFSLLLAPDSQHWKKQWPQAHWRELLRLLQAWEGPRLQITLVGLANALEPETVAEASRGPHRVQSLLGVTRLEDLPDIAARHQVAVCGNSAWLHIAEASGTPVVALAGPIVPGFGFSPWRADSTELSVELSCRPCTLHGSGPCYLKGARYHACMQDISPQSVFAEIKRRLHAGTARP